MKLIKCYKGQEVMVDKEDYDFLMTYKWHFNYKKADTGYVQAGLYVGNYKTKTIYMHRLLMNPQKGFVVDHIDGNTLNNRKSNLRICTQAQNVCNRRKMTKKVTSKYMGVHLHRLTGKYRVQVKGKSFGLYITQEEAMIVRDREVLKLNGNYAKLNSV